MKLANVRVGDVVLCSVRGVEFYALVEAVEIGRLTIEPIGRGYAWRSVGSCQVLAHWRKSRRALR